MHTKVYIDTNVIIDILDTNRPFHKYSVDVLETCFKNDEIELFINSDTLSNIFNVLRSHMKLSLDESLAKMEYITQSFAVVFGDDSYLEATLDICKKHIFKDYEDALQYISALRSSCTLLITNNPKDFKNSSIDVVTSKELSQLWSKTSG